ncbi:serine/threonine-protein kinase, partial [Cylindrospermopsis raciborskii]|uniref:serine/threonine-protein kinase n=1 Tax=Cylindrospermopsis raciborskii TaxID=77022 RepID=UPI0009ECD207
AIVMEYINGISLSKYIEEQGQLPEELALKYINQIGQALEEIHRDNYLHRDINPCNILLRNNNQEAVLIDFGLARSIAAQSMSNSFTHGYAPIEQYSRRGNFGPHTDVYALAATLYYALTANAMKIEGELSPVPALHRKYENEILPEPRTYNRNISQKVNDAILAAMKIEPETRTREITEFRRNLGLLTTVTVSIETDVEPTIEEEPGIREELLITIKTAKEYKKLENLLQAQNFKEADLDTRQIILAVANREREGWLRIEDAEKFPCKELRSIDQLWLKYSRGKFGISVQQQIYQSLGGTKEYNYDVWKSMGDRVGWRHEDYWLSYSNLNFSQTAPSGHLPALLPGLPAGGGRGNVRGIVRECWNASLLSRHAECNI